MIVKAHARITVLAEDNAQYPGLRAEHGLALWVEYGGKRILFDTGQSDALVHNAQVLDIDLAKTDAIVISHGHYDHTGGLASVLDLAPRAAVYAHPASLEPKFSRRDGTVGMIGAPASAKDKIRDRHVVWTTSPTPVFEGATVTGQVPRMDSFESARGPFFTDVACTVQDRLWDDQALFLDTPNGLVVVLGCAHAGVINTIRRIAKLTGKRSFYAVMGGMHLVGAPASRIVRTADVLAEYDVQRIVSAHCTGVSAAKAFEKAFPGRCLTCVTGTKAEL